MGGSSVGKVAADILLAFTSRVNNENVYVVSINLIIPLLPYLNNMMDRLRNEMREFDHVAPICGVVTWYFQVLVSYS